MKKKDRRGEEVEPYLPSIRKGPKDAYAFFNIRWKVTQRVVDPLTDAPPVPNAENVSPLPANGTVEIMASVSEETTFTVLTPLP